MRRLLLLVFLLCCLASPSLGQLAHLYPCLDCPNNFSGTNTFNGVTSFPGGVSGSISPATPGGATLGTAALPYSSVFVGLAATNNIRITGTATAARVFTLPDANSNPVQPSTCAANNFSNGISSAGVIACAQPSFSNISGTLSLTGAVFPNQGTTTTVLHGNAAGNLAFGSVAPGDMTGTTGTGTTFVLSASPTLTGTLAAADITLGAANTLTAATIKAIASNFFQILDANGVSHFFLSNGSPYTNTFVTGNGAGAVLLGSSGKTSVADSNGAITTAAAMAFQTTSQTLPATINNDSAGGIQFANNAGGSFQFGNGGTLFLNQPQGIRFTGATSGNTVLQASAVAGAGTLTLPAATDTLVGKATTDTLTNKTLTAPTVDTINQPAATAFLIKDNQGGTRYSIPSGGVAQATLNNTNVTGGSILTSPTVVTGVSQGSGFKHQRFGATTATSAAVGATQTTAYTWTSAFADANYTVVCTGITQANTAAGPTVESIAAAGFTVRVTAITAAAASFAGVDCIAVHD